MKCYLNYTSSLDGVGRTRIVFSKLGPPSSNVGQTITISKEKDSNRPPSSSPSSGNGELSKEHGPAADVSTSGDNDQTEDQPPISSSVMVEDESTTNSPVAISSNQPESPPSPPESQLSEKKEAWTKFDTPQAEDHGGGGGDGGGDSGSGGMSVPAAAGGGGGVSVPGTAGELVVEDIELEENLEQPSQSASSPLRPNEEELQPLQNGDVFSTPTNEALSVSEPIS